VPAKSGKRSKPSGSDSRGIRSVFGRAVSRVVGWCLACVLVVVLIVMGVYGAWRALFASNPHFALSDVVVNAVGRLPESEVLELLREYGVNVGESNIWELDLCEVRRRLEEHVLVDRATVARRLPGLLVVSIYERQPVAMLKSRSRRLLDDEGCVLPPRYDSGATSLPEIVGVRGVREMEPGSRVTDELVMAALKFLRLIATRPDGRFYDLQTVQVDYNSGTLRVHLKPRGTFRKGAEVRVPCKDMETALDRMAVIVCEQMKESEKTGFIDATYKVNVPVKP